VFRSVEEIRELPLMHAVVIDLLMVEPGRTDELVRPEVMEKLRAQTRIGG